MQERHGFARSAFDLACEAGRPLGREMGTDFQRPWASLGRLWADVEAL